MRTLILFSMFCIVHSATAYFNYYVYAQQWPASFCFEDGSNQRDDCGIASNITTWTNHGLWPSINESYPEYCNNSWPLSLSDILPLVDEMRAKWPSFAGTDLPFWDHEWSKHGTCAAVNPNIRGPYNYFKFALKLNRQYNLLNLFSVHGIIPDEKKCYNHSVVMEASRELFNETAILGCTWDSQAKKQHLAQLEFCFDKEFKLSCNPSAVSMGDRQTSQKFNNGKTMPRVMPCRSTELICYTPITHQSSKNSNM